MGPLWGGKGCQGKDKSVKVSLGTVPGHQRSVTPREGGVQRLQDCRATKVQTSRCLCSATHELVDLDESLWSWLERRLHLALSHFQGSQERYKAYKHLDPLSLLNGANNSS